VGVSDGNKSDLVKRLIFLSKPSSEYEGLLQTVESIVEPTFTAQGKAKPKVVKHYGETFNLVDHFDRMLMEIWYLPQLGKWEVRCLYSMLGVLVIDSFAMYEDKHSHSSKEIPGFGLKDFAVEIGRVKDFHF